MKTISTPKSANVRSSRVEEALTSAPPARPQISAPPAVGCYNFLTCPGWLKTLCRLAVAMLALFLFTVTVWFTGCATAPAPSSGAVASAPPAKTTDIHSKSGAQLWGERCGFCHNVRSPTSFNDAQWEVATMHMRVRANLTGEERTKILEFLKTAN